MNEIAASERRLSAALDRIDQLLESGPSRVVSEGGSDSLGELDALSAENRRLKAEIAELRNNQSAEAVIASPATDTDAGEQAARLSAANEELIAANRVLLDAAETDAAGDAIRKACDAEVEALRAARFAEIANLAEIMGELDRLLGQEKASAPKPAEREKVAATAGQTSFSGIYGDAPDDDGDEEGR